MKLTLTTDREAETVSLPPLVRIAYWARHTPVHFATVILGVICGVYLLTILWPF